MHKNFLLTIISMTLLSGCGQMVTTGNTETSQNPAPQFPSIMGATWGLGYQNFTLSFNQPVVVAGASAKSANGCWCFWYISRCSGVYGPAPSCDNATSTFVFNNNSMGPSCVNLSTGGYCSPTGAMTLDGMAWHEISDPSGNKKCWALSTLIPDNC